MSVYSPKAFIQNDPHSVQQFMVAYPFATLVINTPAGLDSTAIPFILRVNDAVSTTSQWTLAGHIPKANKMWNTANIAEPALVIFHGPNHYISPNWYPSKKTDPRVVPTWNYAAVHVTGQLSFYHNNAWKYEQLVELTNQQERGQEHPWQVSDAPEDYIDKLMNAIVGIEISVDTLQGKFKLSQNQPDINKAALHTHLTRENPAMAALMTDIELGADCI
ncbi:FMN-binding negative transcriptional regulator [Teredinibacter purpureus]|uniref:FMN-binding negative transcriptional regulator n=1 Tax=Teredinibacter purpureus TaxID=2731756 RepID=UPI0006966F7B|nr:FMN-binding negative transcriptional regulator [Teredinibacter purpureus]